MKKKLLAGLAVGAFMVGMAGVAQALTMTDVGSYDTLIASANLGNSSIETETTWVNSILDPDVTFAFKIETTNGAGWEAVTDGAAGTWAHLLVDVNGADLDPAYFLIKTGKIDNADTYRHFLYLNNSDLSYAVITLSDMGITDVLNISKISHITEFDGTDPAPVPEPATMLLMGTGLAGLAAAQRRRKAKKS